MFWKKKAKTTNDKNKLNAKPEYIVTIYDKLGSSAREVSTITCTQERDEDDGLLYLNEKTTEFHALFPSRKNVVKSNRTIDSIKKSIKTLKEKKLKPTENILTHQSKLYKLEQELYFLQHPSGEFISFDDDGMPHIRFLRVNSNFVPLVWDVDLNSIYIPAEPNLKDSLTSMIDKKEKYKLKRDKLKGILEIILLVFFIIGALGNGYWTFHNWKYADSNSSLAKLQERIDASAIICNQAQAVTTERNAQTSIINQNNAEQTKTILEGMTDSLTPKANNQVVTEEIK